jgi:hypothetical protein
MTSELQAILTLVRSAHQCAEIVLFDQRRIWKCLNECEEEAGRVWDEKMREARRERRSLRAEKMKWEREERKGKIMLKMKVGSSAPISEEEGEL